MRVVQVCVCVREELINLWSTIVFLCTGSNVFAVYYCVFQLAFGDTFQGLLSFFPCGTHSLWTLSALDAFSSAKVQWVAIINGFAVNFEWVHCRSVLLHHRLWYINRDIYVMQISVYFVMKEQ